MTIMDEVPHWDMTDSPARYWIDKAGTAAGQGKAETTIACALLSIAESLIALTDATVSMEDGMAIAVSLAP